MRAIETTVSVAADGIATLQLPADIAPGNHQVVIVIGEPSSRNLAATTPPNQRSAFPVIHVGGWIGVGSLRREELYDDSGR
jgi:hypothetical protein